MLKFALKKNQLARGAVKVYNLLIDGIDQFDHFEDGLESKYDSSFRSIGAVINQISENPRAPNRKTRKIHGVNKATEIKKGDLRSYYLAIKEHDLVICLGGYKKNQKKDITRLKSLEKQITQQIEKHGKLEIKK